MAAGGSVEVEGLPLTEPLVEEGETRPGAASVVDMFSVFWEDGEDGSDRWFARGLCS